MLNIDKLFELAKAQGIEDVQVVKNTEGGLALTYYEGHVEKNETNTVTSMEISGIVNGQKGVFTVEDLSMDEKEIVDAIHDIAVNMNGAETFEIFGGSESYPYVKTEASDFHEIPILEKVELLAGIEKMILEKEPRVVKIPSLSYEESVSETAIINTKGMNISKRSENCAVVVELVASDGKEAKVGFDVEIKNNMKDLEVEKMVDKAIEQAVSMFDASPVPSGEYEVIIDSDAMISLVGAFSGMFGGESHLKKVSPIWGKLHEKVFSEKVTICDMPLKEDAVRREPFDEEGVACYNKTVVEAGVFKTMLHNLKTAKAFDTVSTGNAFHGSVSGCNLFLQGGDVTKEEMIASMDKGLLLTEFDGLHAGLNPISGDMSLKTSGYYIEGGKIVRPATLIVMSGNFLSMMNDVKEVGSDLHISFRGVGAPSVKFNKVTISG